jgi:small subunit ribosomal protein S9
MSQTPTLNTELTDASSSQASAAPAPAPAAPKPPDKAGYWWGTGRRKTAVARVRLKAGQGKFLVNGKEVTAYFNEVRDQTDVASPLTLTKTQGSIDVLVNVQGGGYAGQAGAVKLGVARALKDYDPTLEATLREHDLLSRDARKVERKKYGQAGARRRFQFSKR